MTFIAFKKLLEEFDIKGNGLLYLDVVSGIIGTSYYYKIAENDYAFERICNIALRIYLNTNVPLPNICECIMDMLFYEPEENYHIKLEDVLNDNVDIGVIEDCLLNYYD